MMSTNYIRVPKEVTLKLRPAPEPDHRASTGTAHALVTAMSSVAHLKVHGSNRKLVISLSLSLFLPACVYIDK